MPPPKNGVCLTEADQLQIREECTRLITQGVSPGDAKRQLARRWDRSESSIRAICRGVAVPSKTPPQLDLEPVGDPLDDPIKINEIVQAERRMRQLEATANGLKKRILTVEAENNELRDRLDFFTLLAAETETMTITPSPRKNTPDGEAVAIIQASDWHVGEVVHPEKVNYWNKYNPDIAEYSAKLFFERGLKLIKKEQKDVAISKVLLHLGGDLMTGHIHEELKEITAYSPNEEAQFAKYLIIGGLQYWLDNIDEVFVVCSYGNHGRNNPEKKIGVGAENSYEWALYHDVARHFEREPRIKFLIPRGEWTYVDIGPYKIRATHGDSVVYRGGVGGISIPLVKAVHNWNAAMAADMTLLGHFHQTLINDQIGFSVNNCLIGINPYGLRFGRPTPATQSFRLLDLKRGFTKFAPILCDDGDRVKRKSSFPGLETRWQSANLSQREMKL